MAKHIVLVGCEMYPELRATVDDEDYAFVNAFTWYPLIGESDDGIRHVIGAITCVSDGDDEADLMMEELVLAKAHGLVDDPSQVTPATIRERILPRFVSRSRLQ